MDIPSLPGNGTVPDELKTAGYFKMQIGSLLGLSVVNQDPSVGREDVPRIVEHISASVPLRPSAEQSPLSFDRLTVSKLARWFNENQLARAAPKASS